MCLNAGAMGRRDAETETLIPITGAVFDVAHAIQAGALRENPESGPDGVGVQADIAYTLEARAEVQAVAHALRAGGFDASEDGTGRGTPLVPVAFSCKDHGADASEGLSPTLRSMGHDGSHANGGGQMAVAFDTTQITSAANYSNPRPGDPTHPLAAGAHPPAVAFSIMPMNSGKDYKARPTDVAQPIMAGGPVGGNQGGDFIAETWAVRRLTPAECEALQGFPRDWTQVPHRGKPAADGPRYKAIGNSMAVNVMRFIGERIAAVDPLTAQEAQAA